MDHKVREPEEAIDWNFIYPLVRPLYSSFGRPSIDPVVLFINFTFDIHSMRKTWKNPLKAAEDIELIYDEGLDIYICPNNKDLKYTTTSQDIRNTNQIQKTVKDVVDCQFI